MKNLLKYKIWITLLLSPVFIAIGAYNFVTGNVQYFHTWFLWGLISMVIGTLWILISKRT
jgi:hypothetical protein